MKIQLGGWIRKHRVWAVVIAVVGILVIAVWIWFAQQRRAFAERTHCVGNLVAIRLAKSACQEQLGIEDGDPIPTRELERVCESDLGQALIDYKCPSGGTYLIGRAGVAPMCSYSNICYTYRVDWNHLRLVRRSWAHSLGP